MNIVLIALDTQRADHLGCYGYLARTGHDTSPFLDSLAQQGTVFEKCYAPNIPTHPSFTTMLSGKEAITHEIVNIGGGVPIKDGVRLLPEILKGHGFATGAVDTMGRHFSRGFDHYHVPKWDFSDPMTLRRAEHVNDMALPLIEELKAGDKPFFLFLHYWDPHTPYLPPAQYREMFYEGGDPYALDNHSMDPAWNDPRFRWYYHDWMPGVTDSNYVNALYDAETRYLDDHLRHVWEALGEARDETLVLFTADHGEILDDHLGFYDHHGLYEGDVHVPLIMVGPNVPKGKRASGLVQNVDFVPTFLDMLGLEDVDATEGKSLLPILKGEREGNYEEVFLSEATWELKRGYTNGKWKFIDSVEQDYHGRPMQELFDLQADPEEQVDLAQAQPEVMAELKAKLDAWVAKRLEETGRTSDPLRDQGICGTGIGTPVEGEVPGAGSTPLHLKKGAKAAGIPDPSELRETHDKGGVAEAAANTARDEKTGGPLHGYVEEKE